MGIQDIVLALVLGLGLSASCGFRVFVPLFVASLGAMFDMIPVADGFVWLKTWMAVATFGVASLVEVIAYKVPYIDNLLDTIATPVSVIAGTVISASFLGKIDPFLQWTLALIIGGGAAGTIQAGTALVRAGSTVTTAGLANPLFALAESAVSVVASIGALFLPFVAAIGAVILIVFVLFFAKKWLRRNREDSTL